MCVANTCNHSRRGALKVAPQHLTMEELCRCAPKSDGDEEQATTKDLSSPDTTKDLVIASSHILEEESRRTSTLSSTTEATTATDEEEDSCSSISTSTRGGAGGCLKVRTQAQSLARKYKPTVRCQLKNVDWDRAEFRTHNTILANNPAVSWGAPIGIGDEVLSTECFRIDEYEEQRRPRRHTDALRVPRDLRERTLLKEGYSRSEILQVTLKMDRIRNRRRNVALGGPIRQLQTLVLRRRWRQSVLGKRARISS